MADKLYSLVYEIEKVQDTIKNKNKLAEQLDAKIEKTMLVKEKAMATLPLYQKQLDTGLSRVKELYPRHHDTLVRDVRIAESTVKKERAIRHLNDIRRILGLPLMDFDDTSDDPNNQLVPQSLV
jgi:hypothetical protein